MKTWKQMIGIMVITVIIVTACTPKKSDDNAQELSRDLRIDHFTGDILNKFAYVYEFNDPENTGEMIVLWTDIARKNVEFFSLSYDYIDNSFAIEKIFYIIVELYPETALLLNTIIGEELPNRGISYYDDNYVRYYFYISESGIDGSLTLTEFFNPSLPPDSVVGVDYYSKIIIGDLSDFAGNYEYNEMGNITFQLRADGTLNNSEIAADFAFESGGRYSWNRISASGHMIKMMLIPAGVEVIGNDMDYASDTKRHRIVTGEDYDRIFYKAGPERANPIAHSAGDYDAKIMKGDFSDFTGYWVNNSGNRKHLRADGTFLEGETADGFRRNTDTTYSWGISSESNEDGFASGYGVILFPAGFDIIFGSEYFESNAAKVRISMGHDFNPSEIYYKEN